MKRCTETFKTIEEAETFKAALPVGSEAVVMPVKNTEDYRLGCTTAECRTLWVNVHYNETPLPWRK